MPGHAPEEDRLDAVLAWCFEREAAGEVIDLHALCERHPDLADPLRAFFAADQRFRQLTGPLHSSLFSEVNTTPRMAEPPAQASSGEVLGDYEVLEELGRGGMAIVYRARQRSTGRDVALKLLTGEGAEVDRFTREVEATAQLDHPHVISIYEVGQQESQHFFSMRLMEGGTLAALLRAGSVEPRRLATLLEKVARGVHHAHQRGILHRDLKPGNILLDATGEPCVADFGLARSVEGDASLTHTGVILGTPAYLAPEQARAGRHVSTAADIYGLGAILYEGLAGRPPHVGQGKLEVVLAALHDEPVLPRALRPGVDRDLETVCLKCLEREPARRYESAAALGDDLGRWLRGEPVAARPVGRAERAWRWCRRNPLAAGLLTAVLVLTVGLVVGLSSLSLWLWHEVGERERANESEREQRRLANDRAGMARRALDELGKAAQGWMTQDPALLKVKREVLARIVHVHEELLASNPSSPELQHRAAVAHLRAMQVLPGEAREQRLVHLRRARELWEALAAEDTSQPFYRVDLSEVYSHLADLAEGDERFALYERSVALVRTLVEDFPQNLAWPDLQAHRLMRQARGLWSANRLQEAERAAREGLAVATELCRQKEARPAHHKHLASNGWMLAHVLTVLGRREEAIRHLQEAMEKMQWIIPRLREDGYVEDLTLRYELEIYRHDLIRVYLLERRLQKAGKLIGESEPVLRDMLQRLPGERPPVEILGNLLAARADWHDLKGESGQAEACVRELLGLKTPTNYVDRASYAAYGPGGERLPVAMALELADEVSRQARNPDTLTVRGALLLRAGKVSEALAELEASLKQVDLAVPRLLLALALHRVGKPPEAREQYRRSCAIAEKDGHQRDDPAWERLEREAARTLGLPASPERRTP